MSDLIKTADGSFSLISPKFNESYHSKHGAIQESQTVFIDAALKPKLKEAPSSLSILEIGFGSGLNALMTLFHTQDTSVKINYTGVEAYPITQEIATQLNYTELLNCPDLQDSFLKMHINQDESTQLTPSFSFNKRVALFENINDINEFDIIYFDAFAPSAQPELWEEQLLKTMFNAMKKNAILSTYCAKGAFKRTLKSIGFQVEALPGPIGKREITRAHKL